MIVNIHSALAEEYVPSSRLWFRFPKRWLEDIFTACGLSGHERKRAETQLYAGNVVTLGNADYRLCHTDESSGKGEKG